MSRLFFFVVFTAWISLICSACSFEKKSEGDYMQYDRPPVRSYSIPILTVRQDVNPYRDDSGVNNHSSSGGEKSYQDIDDLLRELEAEGKEESGWKLRLADSEAELDVESETPEPTIVRVPDPLEDDSHSDAMEVSFTVSEQAPIVQVGAAESSELEKMEEAKETLALRNPEEVLARLIEVTEQAFATQAENKALRDRLVTLYLLNENEDKAYALISEEEIQSLDATGNLISALAFFREGELDQGVIILEGFLRRLSERMPLQVSKLILSDPSDLRRHPERFGSYTDIGNMPQPPGAEAGIYIELKHFTQLKKEQGFSISLQIETDLLDASGTPVEWTPYPEASGRFVRDSNSRIQDLSIPLVVVLPQHLAEGEYHLQVRIRDMYSKDKLAGVREIPVAFIHR